MSKGKLLLTSFILLAILYILIVVININNLNLYKYWFSLALLFIGVYSLIYSNLYKLDSAFYYATLLIYFAVATSIKHFYGYKFYNFYPIYFFCIALAHLSVFVLYRQKIHFKLFAIFITESILTISYKINFINIYTLIIANLAFLICIIVNGIYRVRKNLRRR